MEPSANQYYRRAIVYLLGLYYLGNDPFSIGLVIIILISISLKLKMGETISLTVVTVLAIMSAPGNEDWLFALNRFIVTFIGMATALLVNIFVYPPNYKKNYVEKINNIFQDFSILMRTAISDEITEKSLKEQMEHLQNNIFQLEEHFLLFDEEREKMAKVNNMDVREIVVFKQMFKSLQQGFTVLADIDSFYFSSKPTPEENQLFDQHLEYLIKYHELFLLKYDGIIKMDLPSFEDEFMKQTEVFLEKVMQSYNEEHKIQLAVIGASIYHYAFQLDRLNTLVEQYRKKSQ